MQNKKRITNMSNLELPIIQLDTATEQERRIQSEHLVEAFRRQVNIFDAAFVWKDAFKMLNIKYM
jgi:hypothetical protein